MSPKKPSKRQADESAARHHVFTVEQANALVPALAPLAARLQELYRELAAGLLERGLSPDDLDEALAESDDDPRMRESLDQMGECIVQIESLGCRVKGLDQISIDFPALIDGEPGYLCWRPGEPCVAHWHTSGDESGERRPLASPTDGPRSALN